MPQAQTYQSEFTGVQMDERFRAVATLAEALTVLEQAIAAKYTKPASGIPSTDMDTAVQNALALALTSVQSLADYYTKSEVDAMVAAVNAQEYVDVATLPAASADTLGKIYLVGPTSGEYARYITTVNGSTYGWVQIGTTEISMANYATKAELSQLDQKMEDIIDGIDGQTVNVSGVASYVEVLFSNPIPKGTVLSYFTQSANGLFYLTDSAGNFSTDYRSDKLKAMLPWRTDKDYYGVKCSSAFNISLVLMGVEGLSSARKQIFIKSTDSEFDILEKFRYAYMVGDMDIIFERAVYTLKEVYPFMKNTLGWTWTMGLPVGNGCRYYGNGSIIKSEAPTGTYTDDRNIFDTKDAGSTFEIYDFILDITGGTYCVHDESSGAESLYYHKYENVTFIADGATTAVGAGTGFDTILDFVNCDFFLSGTTSVCMQLHGPTSNPDSDAISLRVTLDGCYTNVGRSMALNPAQFDIDRDDVFVQVSNCKSPQAIASAALAVVKTYIAFNNTVG